MRIYHSYKNFERSEASYKFSPRSGRLQWGKKVGVVRGRKKGENSKLPHFLRPNLTKYCINLNKIFG